MDLEAARAWFMNMSGGIVRMIPEVTATGAASYRLPGLTGSLVEIFAKNDGCQVIIQLPSRRSDLKRRVVFDLAPDLKNVKINGGIKGGEVMGPATTPLVLSRRSPRITRLHPPSNFSISFNLPYQVALVAANAEEDGMVELYIRKL